MRSTHVNPWESIMTRNRRTEVQELTSEELELVTGESLTETP
jgi:hypothetical protein